MEDIVARAPVRIDFGGGWTDVPPYPAEQGGFVCNVAIARHATARLLSSARHARGEIEPDSEAPDESALATAAARRAGLREARLQLRSDFPIGAGLGGSSAAGVAAVAALAAGAGETVDRAEIAERSRAIEVEDLGVAGGRQDHYAAAFGGALGLVFTERVDVRRIPLSQGTRDALPHHCLVVYTGISRISGETITAVLDAYRDRVPRVMQSLQRMGALAREMAAALAGGALETLGGLVREHWVHQRALHAGITTERIDMIFERAERAGAWGWKALGASGGGCVVILGPEERMEELRRVVRELGQPLEYAVDEDGVTVATHHRAVPVTGGGT